MSGRRRGRGQSYNMEDMLVSPNMQSTKSVPSMNPIRKGMIQGCLAINTVGAFLLSVGWWQITGSALDGALTAVVIICGAVGIALVSMNRE